MRNEEIEAGIRGKDRLLEFFWYVGLIFVGGLILILSNTVLAQYYVVRPYQIWIGVIMLALAAITRFWWYLATTNDHWAADLRASLTTHTALWAVVFCFIAWMIAFVSLFFCDRVFTPDKRNYWTVNAAFSLSAAFTLLMYALPPIGVAETIAPLNGVLKTLYRIFVVLLMLGLIVGFFFYNF